MAAAGLDDQLPRRSGVAEGVQLAVREVDGVGIEMDPAVFRGCLRGVGRREVGFGVEALHVGARLGAGGEQGRWRRPSGTFLVAAVLIGVDIMQLAEDDLARVDAHLPDLLA